MIITATMKMADVIIQNHHLLSVINRFGIQLGFGEKSVDNVCKMHEINTDFFLDMINSFNDPDFFPKQKFKSYPLSLIVDYLYKAHDFYINVKVPEINSLIENLQQSSSGDTAKAVTLIHKFFNEYASQLKSHIEFEEKNVYPYIQELETVYNGGDESTIKEFMLNNEFIIKDYATQHDNIEEKLYDIKNLIIKYISPKENFSLCFKILGQIAHLEEDIKDHSEMENKIIVPQVAIMEQNLQTRN